MFSKDLITYLNNCLTLVKLKNAYEYHADILSQFNPKETDSVSPEQINKLELEAQQHRSEDLPIITVIIVTKNSDTLLQRALQSIQSQDYPNIEILIQDGGSTDKTKEIVREMGLIDSFYVEPDKASIDNLLRASKKAKGEIIAVCWPDDELFPHACRWGVSMLSDKTIDVVYGDQLMVNSLYGVNTLNSGCKWDLAQFATHCFYPPFSSSFFKRSALLSLIDKVTEFDHDEYEFWLWLGLTNIQYRPGLISKCYVHKDTHWIKPGYAKSMINGKHRAFYNFVINAPTHNTLKQHVSEAKIGLSLWAAMHEIVYCHSIPDSLFHLENVACLYNGHSYFEKIIKLLLDESLKNNSLYLEQILAIANQISCLPGFKLDSSVEDIKNSIKPHFIKKEAVPPSIENGLHTPLHASNSTILELDNFRNQIWEKKSSDSKPIISKIAILNPYLQGGHTETAEIESATRFAQAAEKIGIETLVLASSDEIKEFDPDLVIPITYQEPKLTSYPTYGLLTMPVSWVKNVPRFVRNILSYDGYLTVSDSVREWLRQLSLVHNKQIYTATAAFSIQKTHYLPCDFTKAKAVYIGTNWDKSRHQDLFMQLGNGKYLQCYGPQHSWKKYPTSLYGGEIPFDGISSLLTYHKHAVGLCINHPDFDKEGIPSSRTFEIAAAGALPICTANEYTEKIFGNTVIYLEDTRSTNELAEQIGEAIKWIRLNPKIAAEMSQEAHRIFSTQISMDIFLQNIINLHTKVVQEKGMTHHKPTYSYASSTDTNNIANVAYFLIISNPMSNFELTLNSILQQSYPNLKIIIVCTHQVKNIHFSTDLIEKGITFITESDAIKLNALIREFIINNKIQWVGFLTPEDILFPNHTTTLLGTKNHFISCVPFKLAGIFSGALQHSEYFQLQDDTNDDYSINSQAKVRIGYFQYTGGDTLNRPPVHSCLFNFAHFDHSASGFNYLDLCEPIKFQNNSPEAKWLFKPEITSSKNIDNQVMVEKCKSDHFTI